MGALHIPLKALCMQVYEVAHQRSCFLLRDSVIHRQRLAIDVAKFFIRRHDKINSFGQIRGRIWACEYWLMTFHGESLVIYM